MFLNTINYGAPGGHLAILKDARNGFYSPLVLDEEAIVVVGGNDSAIAMTECRGGLYAK